MTFSSLYIQQPARRALCQEIAAPQLNVCLRDAEPVQATGPGNRLREKLFDDLADAVRALCVRRVSVRRSRHVANLDMRVSHCPPPRWVSV